MTAEAPLQQGSGPPRRPRFGLSGKLLVLTILFVMITEVLVYVPSIANFRLNWLNDRLAAARTAALVLDAAPTGMVPESLTRQLLSSIGAKAVAMKMGDQRRLLAISDTLPPVQHNIDMRDMRWYDGRHRRLRSAAVQRRRYHARRRPGAQGRRVRGDRPERSTAA